MRQRPIHDDEITYVHRSPDFRTATNGILTVGDLMRWLKGLPPETHIVVGNDAGGWYDNVEAVHLPGERDGYTAVTLIPGEPFDTRQV